MRYPRLWNRNVCIEYSDLDAWYAAAHRTGLRTGESAGDFEVLWSSLDCAVTSIGVKTMPRVSTGQLWRRASTPVPRRPALHHTALKTQQHTDSSRERSNLLDRRQGVCQSNMLCMHSSAHTSTCAKQGVGWG